MRTANGYIRHDGMILICTGFPHGPTEPCTCDGTAADGTPCGACTGHVTGCTCDIDWSCAADDHGPACWHPALPRSGGNWPAVIAAVHARGPRCDGCGGWTFRPALWTGRSRRLLCTRCEQADTLAARFLMDPPAYSRTEGRP